MKYELLPIGSVVVSNNKMLIIIGFYPSKVNEKKEYKYLCSSVSGIRNEHSKLKLNKDYYFINEEDIQEVLFIGYNDEEFDEYSKFVVEIIKKINDFKSKNKEIKPQDYETIINSYIQEHRKEGKKNE